MCHRECSHLVLHVDRCGSALERLLQSRQQSELILLFTSFFYESMATDNTDGGASPLARLRSEQLKSQLHEALLEILRENPSLLSTASTSAVKSADRPYSMWCMPVESKDPTLGPDLRRAPTVLSLVQC